MLMSVQDISGLTVYAVIRNSSDQIWNGSAFVTFNAGNWATYVIPFTEQPNSGYYSALVPAGIVPGNYNFIAYNQVAGSPAITDLFLGERNFTVQAPISPILQVTALISSLRLMCDDGPDSKVVYEEKFGTPSTPVDGTNKNFKLKSIIVVTGSVYITIVGTGAVYRTQTGFTLTDAANGLLAFGTAPNPGTATQNAGVYASYNWQYFSDEKYNEFLTQASENLQLSQTPPDMTTVPTGLVPALMQYALANFFRARYAQYAAKYSSSGGQSGQSIAEVGKIYLDGAKTAMAEGHRLRDDYYKKQGQSLSPAYAGTTTMGSQIASSIDPITPLR